MYLKFYFTCINGETLVRNVLAHSNICVPVRNEQSLTCTSDSSSVTTAADVTFNWSVLDDKSCPPPSFDPLADIRSHRGFRIAHLNCRSLVLHIDELRTMFAAPCSVHLLSVNETRLDSDILDEEVAIPGYSILRCDRDRWGGGVALYVSDNIDYIPFELLIMLTLKLFLQKLCWGKAVSSFQLFTHLPLLIPYILTISCILLNKLCHLGMKCDFNLNFLVDGPDRNKINDICSLLTSISWLNLQHV